MPKVSRNQFVGAFQSSVKERVLSKLDPTGAIERKEMEEAAARFYKAHLVEYGVPPKWDQLMKNPEFAKAVHAADEAVRRQAAEELLARFLKEKALMEKIEEENRSQYSRERNLDVQAQGGVRANLLKGTEALPENGVLPQLMENFKSIGFKYESTNRKGDAVLNGQLGGDCKTLADAFTTLALELGFKNVRTRGVVRDFMVPGATIVDPQWETGNADNGKAWLFQNHYWVEHGSDIYDVLFTRRKIDLGVTREGPVVDEEDSGLTREIYGGKSYYAGLHKGTYLRYVALEESDLVEIRKAHQLEKASREAVVESEEETAVDPAEGIGDAVHFSEIPQDKRARTTEELNKRFPTGARPASEAMEWASEQIALFCEGRGFNVTFNEDLWEKWVHS